MSLNIANIESHYRVKMIKFYDEMHSNTNKANNNVIDINSRTNIEEVKPACTDFVGEDPELRRLGAGHWLNDFELLECMRNPNFILKLKVIQKLAAEDKYKRYRKTV